MKKSKLFIIPLSAVAVTASSVVPVLASCANKQNISEDYSLSIENENVATDVWYNTNIDKYNTDNKQYVTFELKLNQPFYIEWQNEVVSNIVGLPWVDVKQTEVNYASDKIGSLIEIDTKEINIYPQEDRQTFTLFVPYTLDYEAMTYDEIKEEKLFSLSIAIKFYKGTGEQFENDQMNEIAEPYYNQNLTISHKKIEFVKAPKETTISLSQSNDQVQQKYELYTEGFVVNDEYSTRSINVNPVSGSKISQIFNPQRTDYAINGKQLTITYPLGRTQSGTNLRRFGCLMKSGDIPSFPYGIGDIKMNFDGGSNPAQAWSFQQTWKIDLQLNPEGQFVRFIGDDSRKIDFAQDTQHKPGPTEAKYLQFELVSDLQPGQYINVYGMTENASGWNEESGNLIQPLIMDSTDDAKIKGGLGTGYAINQFTGRKFNVPLMANFTGDIDPGKVITLNDIRFAIECVDASGNLVWTQTVSGFKSTIKTYTE